MYNAIVLYLKRQALVARVVYAGICTSKKQVTSQREDSSTPSPPSINPLLESSLPFLGKAIAAVRTKQPGPNSVCDVFIVHLLGCNRECKLCHLHTVYAVQVSVSVSLSLFVVNEAYVNTHIIHKNKNNNPSLHGMVLEKFLFC